MIVYLISITTVGVFTVKINGQVTAGCLNIMACNVSMGDHFILPAISVVWLHRRVITIYNSLEWSEWGYFKNCPDCRRVNKHVHTYIQICKQAFRKDHIYISLVLYKLLQVIKNHTFLITTMYGNKFKWISWALFAIANNSFCNPVWSEIACTYVVSHLFWVPNCFQWALQ